MKNAKEPRVDEIMGTEVIADVWDLVQECKDEVGAALSKVGGLVDANGKAAGTLHYQVKYIAA